MIYNYTYLTTHGRDNLMPKPRCQQISLSDTPYYHCVSRCVRRAFLCGTDNTTGKSYEHRRVWVEKRLLFIGQVFAIDVCAYAIMNNHTHIVLRVDEEQAMSWSMDEVLNRWQKLFKGTLFCQQYLRGETLPEYALNQLNETTKVYRNRLMDISWFMRVLNEPIAREANLEDGCTGHFWEGRFKSQALLDEAALAACMAYVDLNPIRASIAKTPETSAFTSIKQRIKTAIKGEQPKALAPFLGNPNKHQPSGLQFELKDYIALVDLTGRCIREDKAGYIDNQLPNILTRLNITSENWLMLTKQFERLFPNQAGKEHSITEYCENTHRKRRQNRQNSLKYFA